MRALRLSKDDKDFSSTQAAASRYVASVFTIRQDQAGQGSPDWTMSLMGAGAASRDMLL